MGNSLILGILGVALLTSILGRRPNLAAAVVLGAAYGIAVDAILINGIINPQKIQTLYSAAPHWSWWVANRLVFCTNSPNGVELMSDIACLYETELKETADAGPLGRPGCHPAHDRSA